MKNHLVLTLSLVSTFFAIPTASADPGFCDDPDVVCRHYECHDTKTGWVCNIHYCTVYFNDHCINATSAVVQAERGASAGAGSAWLIGDEDCSGAVDVACTHYWCYTSSHGGGMCFAQTCVIWLGGNCELD